MSNARVDALDQFNRGRTAASATSPATTGPTSGVLHVFKLPSRRAAS
ncbi:MAG: hypothetical protein WDN04_22870 [Rhodospirillales bacterium]